MKIIGLLGGIASGKSLVAEQLGRLGAGLLDGDRAGHEVLRMPEIERLVRDRWGTQVFDADGHVNRKALGRIVFAPSSDGRRELEYLERITHPHIGERLRRQAGELAAQGRAVTVLDAPVMLRAGWDKFCHHIVFVEAPWEIRQCRAIARGWREEEIAARESAQEPVSTKRERADSVIDNSGSRQETQAQVERLWRRLTVPAAHQPEA